MHAHIRANGFRQRQYTRETLLSQQILFLSIIYCTALSFIRFLSKCEQPVSPALFLLCFSDYMRPMTPMCWAQLCSFTTLGLKQEEKNLWNTVAHFMKSRRLQANDLSVFTEELYFPATIFQCSSKTLVNTSSVCAWVCVWECHT